MSADKAAKKNSWLDECAVFLSDVQDSEECQLKEAYVISRRHTRWLLRNAEMLQDVLAMDQRGLITY